MKTKVNFQYLFFGSIDWNSSNRIMHGARQCREFHLLLYFCCRSIPRMLHAYTYIKIQFELIRQQILIDETRKYLVLLLPAVRFISAFLPISRPPPPPFLAYVFIQLTSECKTKTKNTHAYRSLYYWKIFPQPFHRSVYFVCVWTGGIIRFTILCVLWVCVCGCIRCAFPFHGRPTHNFPAWQCQQSCRISNAKTFLPFSTFLVLSLSLVFFLFTPPARSLLPTLLQFSLPLAHSYCHGLYCCIGIYDSIKCRQ